jgi:hypothetical protein
MKESLMVLSRNRILLLSLPVLLAVGLVCVAFAADPPKTITLTGGAVWNGNNKRAELTAVLNPTSPNNYSVVYTVVWQGSTQTWKGLMRGNLRNGEVAGTGATPDGKRTFIFEAVANNGVIEGKTYETTGGKQKLTGPIGLHPA